MKRWNLPDITRKQNLIISIIGKHVVLEGEGEIAVNITAVIKELAKKDEITLNDLRNYLSLSATYSAEAFADTFKKVITELENRKN